MSGFPPLPAITDTDMVLAVFTHESLLSMANDDFGEPKRLAHLGGRVLEQAITYHYFMKKPVMSADDIEVQKTHSPLSPKPAEWFPQIQQQQNVPDYHLLLHAYNLRGKIRCAPDQSSQIDTPQVRLHKPTKTRTSFPTGSNVLLP